MRAEVNHPVICELLTKKIRSDCRDFFHFSFLTRTVPSSLAREFIQVDFQISMARPSKINTYHFPPDTSPLRPLSLDGVRVTLSSCSLRGPATISRHLAEQTQTSPVRALGLGWAGQPQSVCLMDASRSRGRCPRSCRTGGTRERRRVL